MSLLLAPYQSSMRLGSGFNTYTQQLCVDNAVVRDLLTSETEDLEKTLDFGRPKEVAQSVMFKTEIIEKMSDLTDALDIHGALNIKGGNIANVRGNGTFVNSNVINESDINFLITCKVINQTMHDPSLTKFNPLANAKDSNFTDIFGDSFISGFQMGGEFTALISIKVHDKEQLNSITAEATIAFTTPNFTGKEGTETNEAESPAETDANAPKEVAQGADEQASKPATDKTAAKKGSGGLSIEADAKIRKTRLDIMSQNTVTISVSWTGGGQDIKASNEDWNFETVRAAAIKFPELVARTPVRTHAVLTKYTSLRSYYSLLNKTTVLVPASYENAGIYTSMLQDAYLDYKNLYKDLQILGTDVDLGKKILKLSDKSLLGDKGDKPVKSDSPSEESITIAAASSEPTPSTDATSGDVEIIQPGDAETPSGSDTGVEVPIVPKRDPFNRDEPYPANLIGLELAKRDIRINMSRILTEVDTIAKNPPLAMLEDRDTTFMTPLLFKQYVPRGIDVPEEK